MESVEMHAIINGRVQGVCFRATTEMHAKNLGLKGSVRNCADGSVEIYAQGSKKSLEELISRLKSDAGSARVDNVDLHYSEPQKKFSSFSTIY